VNKPKRPSFLKLSGLWRVVAVTASVWCLGVATPSRICLAADSAPVRIEFWRTGDDRLTIRFAEALQQALRESGSFTLVPRDEPRASGTVVLTIEENLYWTRTEQGTTASYRIAFRGSANQPLGSSVGSCLESDLSACAAQAVKDAKLAAANLR
jgi:hypothetical protein